VKTSITTIFLASIAGSASALPLKLGNQWIYARGDSAVAETLTVQSSVPCDSGILWKLQWNSDPLRQPRILSRKDGTQSWVVQDEYEPYIPAPWDPQPLDSLLLFPNPHRGLGDSLVALPDQFGALEANLGFMMSYSFYGLKEGILSAGWFEGHGISVSWLPTRGKWSDSIGWLAFQGGWTLRSFNNTLLPAISLNRVMDTLPVGAFREWEAQVVPCSGESLTGWNEADSSRILYSWKIQQAPPDSAGWMRRVIEQTETVQGISASRVRDWRWLPRTGSLSGDTAWWSAWAASAVLPVAVDSVRSDTVRSYSYSRFFAYAGSPTGSRVESVFLSRLPYGLDSGSYAFENYLVSGSPKSVCRTMRMLRANDIPVRTTGLDRSPGQVPAFKARGPNSISEYLLDHPQAHLSIIDPQGRIHGLDGPNALATLGSRHGAVFVSVTEGTTTSFSKLLLP
jgi:hypothetical protein